MENSQSSSEHGQKVRSKATFSPGDFNKDGNSRSRRQPLQQEGGGSGCSPYRLVILCLGLLNAALLIAGIVLGIYCSQFDGGYNHFPHSVVTPLIMEVNHLRSNHSDLIKAKADAHKALESELGVHMKMKTELEWQKMVNDGLQIQIEALQMEKTNLLSNKSVFEESCGRCKPGWVILNTSCYFFSNPNADSQKNWPDSRQDCISRGADLLVIDNWEEQQLMTDSYRRVSTSGTWWRNGYWMGLTDIEREGTWVWINNVTQQEPLYWINGEPNNHGEQGENCAAFYSRGNAHSTWYDGKCHHHQYNWICEMKPRAGIANI